MASRIPLYRRGPVERGAVEQQQGPAFTDSGAQASASSSGSTTLYEPQYTFNIVHEQRANLRRLLPESSSEESDGNLPGPSSGPLHVQMRPSNIPERISFDESRMIRRDEPRSRFSSATGSPPDPAAPNDPPAWQVSEPRNTRGFVPYSVPEPMRTSLQGRGNPQQWPEAQSEGQIGHPTPMYHYPTRYSNVAQQARPLPAPPTFYSMPPPRSRPMAQPVAQYPIGPRRNDFDSYDTPYYQESSTAELTPIMEVQELVGQSHSSVYQPQTYMALEETGYVRASTSALHDMPAHAQTHATSGNEGIRTSGLSNDQDDDLPSSYNIQPIATSANEATGVAEDEHVAPPSSSPQRPLHRVAGSRSLSQRSSSPTHSATENRALLDQLGGLHVHVHIDNSKYKKATIGREHAGLLNPSISSRAPSPGSAEPPIPDSVSSSLLRASVTHLENDPNLPSVAVFNSAPEPGRRGRPGQCTVVVTGPPAPAQTQNDGLAEQVAVPHSPRASGQPISEGLQITSNADIEAAVPDVSNMRPTTPEGHAYDGHRLPQGNLHEENIHPTPGPSNVAPEGHDVDLLPQGNLREEFGLDIQPTAGPSNVRPLAPDVDLLPRGNLHGEESGVNSDHPTAGPSNVRPVAPEEHDVDRSPEGPVNLTEERRVSSAIDSPLTPETLERRDTVHNMPQQPTTASWQPFEGFRHPGPQDAMRSPRPNHGQRPSQRRVRGPQLREVLFDPNLPGGFVDYTQIKNLYRRTRRRRILRFLGVTNEKENRELAYRMN